MSNGPKSTQPIGPAALRDAWDDFDMSRDALNVTETTKEFYQFTARRFVLWLADALGITDPAEVSEFHARKYLNHLREDRDVTDGTVHAHACAVRALLNFWHSKGWVPEDATVKFDMPKVAKQRRDRITPQEFARLLSLCENPRDRALLLFLGDNGARRAEVVALNWRDVDLKSKTAIILEGKGRKWRPVPFGTRTQTALREYWRGLDNRDPDASVFQSLRGGGRLTGNGLYQWLARLGKRAGIKVTPHVLRRYAARQLYSAGMDVETLAKIMGHSTTRVTWGYIGEPTAEETAAKFADFSPMDRLKIAA